MAKKELTYLNLSAGIFHIILGIVFSGYFASMNAKYPNQPIQGVELSMRDHSIDLQIRNTGCAPSQNFCDSSGNAISASWISSQGSVVNIKWVQGMLCIFFFITGAFHLFYAYSESYGGESGLYRTAITNKNNYFRWIEYSITSTLMLYVIALISGIKDSNIYITLAMNNVAMIYMGQLIETMVQDQNNPYLWIIPTVISWGLLISEWAVIIRDFQRRISKVSTFINSNQNSSLTNNASIPSWIQYTIYILAFFFICFGFISLAGCLFYKDQYDSIEYAYIIASFIAKATLGVFIAYGTGQRQRGWKSSP